LALVPDLGTPPGRWDDADTAKIPATHAAPRNVVHRPLALVRHEGLR
jgi:hypothetical protein